MGLLTRLGGRVGGKNGQGRLSVGQSLSDVNTVKKKKIQMLCFIAKKTQLY